jgi:hypothetical protein
MYPITAADREWAKAHVARVGGSEENALRHLVEFKQGARHQGGEKVFERTGPVIFHRA